MKSGVSQRHEARMTFRRDLNLYELKLSGPQSTNLFNGVDKTIENLDQRNVWALCVNELNPGLPDILKVERCTQFVFTRFKRDLVLKRDDEEGLWVLAKRDQPKKPEDGGDGGAPPPPDDDDGGAGGGLGQGGASQAKPLPAQPVRVPDAGDEYRPISAVPRRRRAHGASSRAAFMWRAFEALRETPTFCHTRAVVIEMILRLNSAVRRFAEQAQNALLLALGWDCGVNFAVTYADDLVQDRRFGAVLEPRTVERAGTKLTVWTFSPYDKPKWELWLFGRLLEDEQVAA
jgi:hypothetical protein